MQSNTDIARKVFQEILDKIEQLATVNTQDDLFEHKQNIEKILQLSSFLETLNHYSNTNDESYVESQAVEVHSVHQNESELAGNSYSTETEEGFGFDPDTLEEEAKFNNELNGIYDDLLTKEEAVENSSEARIEELFSINEEAIETYEKRGKIVEFNAETEVEETAETAQEAREKIEKEAKIKLASIKGIKKEENYASPLESAPSDSSAFTSTAENGSLLKTNVSTDYMEAEKDKPIFKLDVNDRIAFTKTLFNGSQTDLNDTVNHLNSFKTLDQAKEYLSEIYYEKGWEKADEYAQRLWSLVESKFL